MVAQVSDPFSGSFHAVLYDEVETAQRNDENYYFKNSYPSQPYITVPKDRATYLQYRELQQNLQAQAQFIQHYQRVLGQQPTFNMDPNGTYWTIYDDIYAIAMIRK